VSGLLFHAGIHCNSGSTARVVWCVAVGPTPVWPHGLCERVTTSVWCTRYVRLDLCAAVGVSYNQRGHGMHVGVLLTQWLRMHLGSTQAWCLLCKQGLSAAQCYHIVDSFSVWLFAMGCMFCCCMSTHTAQPVLLLLLLHQCIHTETDTVADVACFNLRGVCIDGPVDDTTPHTATVRAP
jgi:hypothetical protein